ncbi:hypothetical protein [Streptomyces sp. NPDC005438]|uniref:hypothetical protein n=1 Tax=Streptomyces sp. NPDC005438 TaxID=3156880 RepID=UPI0033A5FA88
MTQPTAPPAVPPPSGAPLDPAPPDSERLTRVAATAWSEGAAKLRNSTTTEPGRLRLLGAVLATLILAFGAVTSWQISSRAQVTDAVVDHSQPLSADAASVYRSLADADTTAASGFLAGGEEPPAVRERYERNIRQASRLLAKAASNSGGSASARREVTRLNEHLPRYTGLVEAARSNNRQGLPLGGAYLRYANEEMRTELLPSAHRLYEAESARLDRDYQDAESWPWAGTALGLLALGVLVWAQRRNYRLTNRVFNRGLVVATAAVLLGVLWLSVGQGLARSGLRESDEHGARSLRALNEAWTTALAARGDENITLVARGAGEEYEKSYQRGINAFHGDKTTSAGGQLRKAEKLADDDAGRDPVRAASRATAQWRDLHAKARWQDDSGSYDKAVDMVIGSKNSTAESFDRVNASLREAVKHEQSQFEGAARSGRTALTGLTVGTLVLAAAGAVAALMGVGRRLAEYR